MLVYVAIKAVNKLTEDCSWGGRERWSLSRGVDQSASAQTAGGLGITNLQNIGWAL
jgi:hypothetical protein